MKIEQSTISMTDMLQSEKTSSTEQGSKKQTSGNIYAGDLNDMLDPIAKKRKEAQERAMKIVGDAFDGEKQIDADVNHRRDRVRAAESEMLDAQKEINAIDAEKSDIKELYQVTDDSQEQQDLELLEKRRELSKTGQLGVLTEDETQRLAAIDKQGMTEYQTRILELDGRQDHFKGLQEDAEKVRTEENAIIRGIQLERLKSHPMIDAQKSAEQVLESAADEIKGMIVDEAKDHIDEDLEDAKDDAEEKAEDKKEQQEMLDAIKAKKEQMEALAGQHQTESSKKSEDGVDLSTKQMLELDQLHTDVQKEVEDLVDKMKLVAEDIKGAMVDQQL